MNKIVKLSSLQDGDRFEIPTLIGIMRNLRVVRTGTGSCLVSGSKLEDADDPKSGWNAFQYCISLSTPVIYLPPNVEETKVDAEVKPVVVPKPAKVEKPVVEATEPAVKRSRGRPSKNLTIQFPKEDWTVADVAKLNNCKGYHVVNEIKRLTASGQLALMEIGQRKTGGKGKPSKVFRMA